MLLRKGQSLLFVTLASRGAETSGPADESWASAAERLLLTAYPDLELRTETHAFACASAERPEPGWLEAARRMKPDWLALPPLTVRDLEAAQGNGVTLSPELFKAALGRVLTEARAHAKRVTLLLPYGLDAEEANRLLPYADAAYSAAWDAGCQPVDAQSAIDFAANRHAILADESDKAALRADVELALANAFLPRLGFQWVKRNSFVLPPSELSPRCMPFSS